MKKLAADTGRIADYYDGPEVKRPIGWWLVSPLGHNYLDTVSAWRVEVYPKEDVVKLFVVFKDGYEHYEPLNPYRDWVKEQTGLTCVIFACDSADRWKRNLVRVYTDEVDAL